MVVEGGEAVAAAMGRGSRSRPARSVTFGIGRCSVRRGPRMRARSCVGGQVVQLTNETHARWCCDATSMSSSVTCDTTVLALTRSTAGDQSRASATHRTPWAIRSQLRRRIQRPMPRSPLHATHFWMTPYARTCTTVSAADGHAAGAVAREMVVVPATPRYSSASLTAIARRWSGCDSGRGNPFRVSVRWRLPGSVSVGALIGRRTRCRRRTPPRRVLCRGRARQT